jgi:hypothetical protein
MSSARDGPSNPASATNRKQNEILDTTQAILRLPHTHTHWETKARFPYINLLFQMKNMIFRDMTLCSSEGKYDCFGATCCLYHQCKRYLKQVFPNVQDIYNKNQYITNFWKWDTRTDQFYLFSINLHIFLKKKSNIDITQRFQNKVLRNMVNAPWYIRNNDLHRDLQVDVVSREI